MSQYNFTEDEINTLQNDLLDQKRKLSRITPMQSIWIDLSHAAARKTVCRWMDIIAEKDRWFIDSTNDIDLFTMLRPMVLTVTAMFVAITHDWPANNDKEAKMSRKILDTIPEASNDHIELFISCCFDTNNGNFTAGAVSRARRLAEDLVNNAALNVYASPLAHSFDNYQSILKTLDRKVMAMSETVSTPGILKVGTGAEAQIADIEERLDFTDFMEDDRDSAAVRSLDRSIGARDIFDRKSESAIDCDISDLDRLVKNMK